MKKGVLHRILIAAIAGMSLLSAGCGMDNIANMEEILSMNTESNADTTSVSKEDILTGDTTDKAESETAEFVVDKEPRSGFMQEGEALTEVPDGYVGIDTAEDSKNAVEDILLKRHYADMLSAISIGGYFPEDEKQTYHDYLIEYKNNNSFAVCDIDNDGVEELLVEVSSGSMAEKRFVIYQYDLENDNVKVEFEEFTNEVFYDNGILIDHFSHNHGFGDAIKPYNIYQYDAQKDTYIYLGYVDSWNKEIADTDLNGNAFPDDIDIDGDGNVYYIADADGIVEIVDGPQFDKWQKEIIAGAEEIKIDWQRLKSDNYSVYTKAYIQSCMQKIKEETADNVKDIGYLYMNCKENGSDYMDAISQECGIEIEKEEELSYAGYVEGQRVITIWEDNTGNINYESVRDNICMFGLYPGMQASEAGSILEKLGFEQTDYDEHSYSTGDGFGNYYVHYSEENGVVISISVYEGSRFAG